MTRTVAFRRTSRTSRTSRADRRKRLSVAALRRARFVRLAADLDRTRPIVVPVPLPAAPAKPGSATAATPDSAATATPDSAATATPGSDTAGTPTVAHRLTTGGGGDAWTGTCSCGQWETTRAMKREANVKGAHTRHANAA
jgi:hypothetical protein